ncbi:energy-coupling factor ABC transporter ATP-binding protein [Phascolarctobacterium sp.]
MLEAKEVNFAYRRGLPVLNDIDCTISDGEFVALLGHNGSGKTTLSRLFMALLHPRSGQVLVDGEDIVNYEPADLADKIGYVFQNPDLQILEDTVFDEVAYGPKAKKLTSETIKKQVEAALAATGLSELAGAYPRLLSFGQKRRLGVASALALNPRTLILDEITNGQDAIEKERMMQYLQSLNEEKGITIVLISHDMDVVRRYAKRAIVLKDGYLVYDGTPTELFGGAHNVEEWGLRRPTAAALAGSLGFTAATPEEFCSRLVRKGAED